MTGQSQPQNHPGRQSPALTGATHPRWRAAAVGDAGLLPVRTPPRRRNRGADYHTKPEPSFSGSGLERRRNGMSLLSHLCGSKGYGFCADEAAAKLDAETMQVCCAELSLPILPSERGRKVQKTIGFLAHLFPLLFCASRKAGSPGGEIFPFAALTMICQLFDRRGTALPTGDFPQSNRIPPPPPRGIRKIKSRGASEAAHTSAVCQKGAFSQTDFFRRISLTTLDRLYLWIITNRRSNAAASTDVITNTGSAPNRPEKKTGTKLSTTITSCTSSA